MREDSDAMCVFFCFGLVWDFFCFGWVKKKRWNSSFFFVAGISNFSLASKLAKQNWARESDLALQNDSYNTWLDRESSWFKT
jgi:hypothetical protein